MGHQFKKHYTVEQARELIPQLRLWLRELNQHRNQVKQLDDRLGQLLASGVDAGGEFVNDWIKHLAGLQKILTQFQALQIQIKDIERGLLDFPAFIAGKEVFLCWEQDEDNIEFWHDLNTGFAGRERLPEA